MTSHILWFFCHTKEICKQLRVYYHLCSCQSTLSLVVGKKEIKVIFLQNNLSKSWLTPAQVVVHLPLYRGGFPGPTNIYVLITPWNQLLCISSSKCCFAYSLLVEIIFYSVLTYFSIANKKQKKSTKRRKMQGKRGQPAFRWYSQTLADTQIWHGENMSFFS